MATDLPEVETYLELRVGRFRLAVRTTAVLGVMQSRPLLDKVSFRGEPLPLVDLQTLFGGEPRAVLPFAVAVESGERRLVLGVDGVDHLRAGELGRLVALPRFGLTRPDLFEGVRRQGQGLLLVVDSKAILTVARRDI